MDAPATQTRRENYDKVLNILQEGKLSGVVNTCEDGKIEILIEWGDWKHEHGYLKYLMKKNGFLLIDEQVTEEDGSDCYSAVHTYMSLAEFIKTKKQQFYNNKNNFTKVMGA